MLGFISDLILQINEIDTCIAYNYRDEKIKLSIRSSQRSIDASLLAQFLTKEIGSGGGHKNKAAGYIEKSKFLLKYPNQSLEQYLQQRVEESHIF